MSIIAQSTYSTFMYTEPLHYQWEENLFIQKMFYDRSTNSAAFCALQ